MAEIINPRTLLLMKTYRIGKYEDATKALQEGRITKAQHKAIIDVLHAWDNLNADIGYVADQAKGLYNAGVNTVKNVKNEVTKSVQNNEVKSKNKPNPSNPYDHRNLPNPSIQSVHRGIDKSVKENRKALEEGKKNVDMTNPINNLVVNTAERGQGLIELVNNPLQTGKDLVEGVKYVSNNPEVIPQAINNWIQSDDRDVVVPFDLGLGAAGIVDIAANASNIARGAKQLIKPKIPNEQVLPPRTQGTTELNTKTNIPSLEGKTNVINDNGTLKYKNTTDINELPKQQPIGRTTDARLVQGEVKSFEELPKVQKQPQTSIPEEGIMTEEDIKRAKALNDIRKRNEYVESVDKNMKALEDRFYGRENLNTLLDYINAETTPQELSDWRASYIAHQQGAMGGGNPADILYKTNEGLKIDPTLAFENDLAQYLPVGFGEIRVLPKQAFDVKNQTKPYVGTTNLENMTDSVIHEMTHGLNREAAMGESSMLSNTRESQIYRARHGNNINAYNESAAHAMGDITEIQPMKQPYVQKYYKNRSYDPDLSNPNIYNQRGLYLSDVGGYKTLAEAGVLKPTDLQILNEQNLMGRLDPNYQSPLDTMYLKTFDQIGNGGGL